MIKKIFVLTILSTLYVINVCSQQKFASIFDNFKIKDKPVNFEVINDTITNYFDKLDNKQNFMYGKNYKMLLLDSVGDFSLFGAFPNSYITRSLETGLWIPVHYFYLFDHANKRCFSLIFHIAPEFNSFNGKDISIDHNFGIINSSLHFIIELNKNFTARSSITLASLYPARDSKEQKGDIIGRAYYYQKNGAWYKRSVTFYPEYVKIGDLPYTNFLNMLSDGIDCNEVSQDIICEDSNCYEARGYLKKNK